MHSGRQEYANLDRERLEWLATFSSEHADELRRRQREEAAASRAEEISAFARSITNPDWSRRDRTNPDPEISAFAEAITSPYGSLCEQGPWNPAEHPRRGTDPNAGWFAPKGGGGNAGGDATGAQADRVLIKIKLAGGKSWKGDRVLDALRAVAPEWVPFIQQHVTLAGTSYGDKGSSTRVRYGENGPAVGDVERDYDPHGRRTIHFAIPPDWNDGQVVQYILQQLADDNDAHRLAAQWATDRPSLFGKLRDARFRQGLDTVAALAQGYYGALAGLAPGSGAVVAVWDIQRGDYLGAALGAAFMLPLGAIAKKGVEAGGTIAFKAGDSLLAALPVKLVQRVQKLQPEQQSLLVQRLLSAKTVDEAAAITNKFLRLPFDRHHPLPKFLGGDMKQALATIPKDIHKEFHAELRRELTAAGFTLPIGTKRGSRDAWFRHLGNNPGSQTKAFEAVHKASATIDEKHGTSLVDFVIGNLNGGNFYLIP